MKIPRVPILSLVLVLTLSLLPSLSSKTHSKNPKNFLQCLVSNSSSHPNTQQPIYTYTTQNSSYTSILLSGIQNLRFVSRKRTNKPSYIFTPSNEPQIQTVVSCSKSNGYELRIRSGGHDYEGLSYTARSPFVMIDLRNFSSIEINVDNQSAWIGAGVRVGNLYYQIAEESRTLGFPAGLGPTIGVGGHFSGGGFGTMLRKYGLAADNILDARIVVADGRVLNRSSMGEDLFWAIRGGGAASFGVVTAWKIRLVPVPDTVTVFTVDRTLDQNATVLVHRWQFIADKFDRDLFVRIVIKRANSSNNGGKPMIVASFNSMFLGTPTMLLDLMNANFSELMLSESDCVEKSWLESTIYFSDLPEGSTFEDLIRTNPYPMRYYKAKSDFVTSPIPKYALKGLWRHLFEDEAALALLIFSPYGGRMSEIREWETPFPHRKGNIYEIQYLAYWDEEENRNAEKYINWTRRVYKYVEPYVSKNPRAAYLNYRDLDLGVNDAVNTSVARSSVWGKKYFKNNFKRLVRVKTRVDPDNFFRNEQSIPVSSSYVHRCRGCSISSGH